MNPVPLDSIYGKAVIHYENMIKFSIKKNTLNPVTPVTKSLMYFSIRESWQSSHCPYCKFYSTYTPSQETICGVCPLFSEEYKNKYENNSKHCCNMLWYIMSSSLTWGMFYQRAKKVLEYIAEHGINEVTIKCPVTE